MTKAKGIAAIIGLAALIMVIVAACGNGDDSTPAANSEPTGGAPSTAAPTGGQAGQPALGVPAPAPGVPSDPNTLIRSVEPSVGAPAPVIAPVPAIVGQVAGAPPVGVTQVEGRALTQAIAPLLQVGSSQTGIWVTGEGTVTLQPDLALLNLGVETFAKTVAEARDEAARAMDAIVSALHDRGVEDKDIQTRFFNISPQYEFPEVFEEGIRTRKQVLVGYRVNNSAAVKIRDLDAVGQIIDEVATAGGDATRINGISFTVEDPKPFMATLREAAVGDALAKAQQLASLTGVSLGRLVFISESGGRLPVVRAIQEDTFFAAAAAPPPSAISGGELELRMTVQAVFGIQ